MDWFEKLTGFRETNYVDTKAKLDVKDGRLFSTVNGASYAIGEQTGHASDVMLGRYIRDGELFTDNAAGVIL